MAYINVEEGLPGIIGLLEYRLDTAKPIRELTQLLLRGDSTLPEAVRELIATVVSDGNECRFCTAAHTEAANLLIGNAQITEQVKTNIDTAPISEKVKALLKIAKQVQRSGKDVSEADILVAREAGATDMEIHDTVLIAALFCLYNRYVDGLSTWTPENPEFYKMLAGRIVPKGYMRPEAGYKKLKYREEEDRDQD